MIKVKALFLLGLFLLHTAVGVACALIMPRQLIPVPPPTVEHHSHQTHSHIGQAATSHSHVATPASQHRKAEKKEACCQDEVSEIAALAKIIPQKIVSPTSPLFFAVAPTYIYQPTIFITNTLSPREKYFARGYHPPIPQIRLAIQSFLI